MNPEVVKIARKKIGDYLKDIREGKKLTYYAAAKASGLTIANIQNIEAGGGYTIDSFLQYTHAVNCYFYLSDKAEGSLLDQMDNPI